MKIYIKNRKKLLIFGFIHLLFVFSFKTNAAECGILQLQKNRSTGVVINSNQCKEPSYISLGTVFDLSAKGRLWLKSVPSQSAKGEFQMICQNRSPNTVQFEFSDKDLPWLTQTKLKNCSGWVENKLSCDGNMGEKNGIYCVLSYSKSSSKNKAIPIRTTSVKMRGISLLPESKNSPISSDKKRTLEAIKPELGVCKQLNQTTQKLKLSWSVNQSPKNTDIKLISAKGINNSLLAECVKTVINTFSYPKFQEKVTFNSEF